MLTPAIEAEVAEKIDTPRTALKRVPAYGMNAGLIGRGGRRRLVAIPIQAG